MENKRKSGQRPDLIPDAISYTSIIRSLAKHDNPEGLSLKTYILNKAKANEEDSGLKNVMMLAQIESNDDSAAAAEKAEQFLRSMMKESQNEPSKTKPVSRTAFFVTCIHYSAHQNCFRTLSRSIL
jgi:hypothetical protein